MGISEVVIKRQGELQNILYKYASTSQCLLLAVKSSRDDIVNVLSCDGGKREKHTCSVRSTNLLPGSCLR